MDSSKLKDYDTLLNPTFNRFHDSSPATSNATICLSLIARAGITNASDVRTWLNLRGSKNLDLIQFVNSSAWHKLLKSSDSYLSTTPEAHLELLCERVLGRFLTSPPGPQRVLPDKDQKMNVALVAIALRVIQSLRAPEPRDSVLLSSAALAVDLGTTRVTAHKLMSDMVDHGYLNRVSARPGSAARFRIPATTRAERKTLNQLDKSVYETLRDSLLQGGLLSQIIHPAFSHVESGHKPWLMAASMLAESGPESVGLRRRQDVPKLRVAVEEMMLLEPDLNQNLDDYSDLMGGTEKHAAAIATREVEIEARRAEIGVAKAASAGAKERAVKALVKMEEAVGRMPSGRSNALTLQSWAKKASTWLQDVFERFPETRAYAPTTATELDRRASRLGWPEDARRLLIVG